MCADCSSLRWMSAVVIWIHDVHMCHKMIQVLHCVYVKKKCKSLSATFWSNESHNTQTHKQTHTHTHTHWGLCFSDCSPVIRLRHICALHSSDVTNALRAPRGASYSVRPSITPSLHTHQIFIVEIQPLESASCHYILSIVYLYVTSCNTRRHIWLRTTMMMSWCTFSCMDEQWKEIPEFQEDGWKTKLSVICQKGGGGNF